MKSFDIPNTEISRIEHAQKIYTPLKMHSTNLLLVFVTTPTIAFGFSFNHPPVFSSCLVKAVVC